MSDQKIDIDGKAFSVEDLEKAVESMQKKLAQVQPLMLPMGYNSFNKARQHNKDRFLKYCHNGTILKHGTSDVEWEVIGVEQRDVDVSTSNMAFDYQETFVKMKSLKGGQKTGKKYVKKVSLENFHMYDIVDVPPAVKVLWGDPKDNPPKKSEDFEEAINVTSVKRDGNMLKVDVKVKMSRAIDFLIMDAGIIPKDE